MSESTTEVLVGAAVLAVAIGFLAYVSQATGFSSAKNSDYPLTASFRSGEGITVGTDVRLAGVKVGTISQMQLNAETFRADVTLSMKEGIPIPDDSAIVVSSEGLLGGNFVEIYPGASMDNFEADDDIEDTQGAISLVSLLMKFVSGKDEE